jgi:hypothetical protein
MFCSLFDSLSVRTANATLKNCLDAVPDFIRRSDGKSLNVTSSRYGLIILPELLEVLHRVDEGMEMVDQKEIWLSKVI